ncbi:MULTISPECIES: TrkH family potassium uptake protein [Haloarcula]|uniref:Potassium transporter TrkH n=1 Tax=Haloarcula pellucida TaxID=1427151 RepID=A0A830GMK1_9EURY|nr:MULTISPECIES: TrkH family potassium uptake protein [Halomicroarcula]MBX0348195.1 TrkH family potassium uptake protein [Halomicroarcula pellucida]MDS0278050.1 TrkH family potassium uptake protein [Halomicroarcula sp. S1AR25-4]GGN97414.1 potassium transporter TrkH [Halomicroarcula pellucida]
MLGATAQSRSLRVDWRAAVSLVGSVVKYLSVAMLAPMLLALYYGEDVGVFGITIVLTVFAGIALERLDTDPDLGAREAFLMVSLTWLAVTVVGAVPYVLAGMGTESTLANPVNALFESMSGFTTTGATVMGSIGFERHSHALLLWRQLTQWLGGMGIVVLAVAILPELSVGGAQLMDAEAPGPGIEKLTPRIAETARALWLAYLGFTVLEFVLLYGLHLAGFAPNMGLYNAVAHPLTTMPTGGFSPAARSIEAFSAAVQWVVIPFMVVAGTNFALIWRATQGNLDVFHEDSEFRFYAGVMATLSAVIAGLLFAGLGPGLASIPEQVLPIDGSAERSLRHATFQVTSIVTTTGYASMDFNTWSDATKYLLLFGMFVGGSAGSTGGAVKMIRWLVILKSLRRELFTTIHPEAVSPVRLGGRVIDERAVRGIYAFTLLYLVLFFVSVAVVFFDCARVGYSLSVLEVMSAVAATLGNVGPGFGAVGPMNGYTDFAWTSKAYMIFLMWAGRLEILPVFVLLTRAYWRS